MSGWQGPKRRWVGEGNGTPLQYSCLENPMDGGTWKAAVHGVAKSRTQLSDLAAAKRRWIRKEVGIAMKGQQEGSL